VVLLVEDSPADVELTCLALNDESPGTVFVARDGVDALAFLRHEGAHADAPTPDLVLLDLNLPRLDGRGVLAGMRQHQALKRIPVVVLTSSAAPEDVDGAYEAGCSCFVRKPVDLDAYLATVRAIRHFWLTVATPWPPARRA
jgi:CheY-like chemotaxis protein